jgi:hypothetical protein
VLLCVGRWSIAGHDSDGRLDGGFHYEHHSHPDANFGCLGFMDVFCGTMYVGEKVDCKGAGIQPQYMRRYLGRLHSWLQDGGALATRQKKRC